MTTVTIFRTNGGAPVQIEVKLERPDLANGIHGVYVNGVRVTQVADESRKVAFEVARRVAQQVLAV